MVNTPPFYSGDPEFDSLTLRPAVLNEFFYDFLQFVHLLPNSSFTIILPPDV
jgi:hypothetical protein